LLRTSGAAAGTESQFQAIQPANCKMQNNQSRDKHRSTPLPVRGCNPVHLAISKTHPLPESAPTLKYPPSENVSL
jgi:hypothetical protein